VLTVEAAVSGCIIGLAGGEASCHGRFALSNRKNVH
jgi:hypothetical protein